MSATNSDSVGRGSSGSKMLKDNKKVSRHSRKKYLINVTANLGFKKKLILNYFEFE